MPCWLESHATTLTPEGPVSVTLTHDEIDARMSFNESTMQEELFGHQYVQKTLEPRDAMGQQGDAQEDQQAVESIPELEPYSNESASDNDGNECAAVESKCSCTVALWMKRSQRAR